MDDYNISASQVKSHSKCALRYWFRYIEGKENTKQDNDYLKLGSRVHETIESVLQERPPTENRQILRDIITDRYRQRGEPELPEDFYSTGVKCCEKAADYIAKHQPEFRDIEKRVEFDINRPDLETGVTAIMDVTTQNEIWDWKTGRIRDDIEHEEKIQGTLYMAAFQVEYGETPESIKFVYLKEGKARTVDPTDENWNYMVKRAKALARSKRTGEYPANPGDHCYWCGYEFWCPAAPTGCGNVPWEDY